MLQRQVVQRPCKDICYIVTNSTDSSKQTRIKRYFRYFLIIPLNVYQPLHSKHYIEQSSRFFCSWGLFMFCFARRRGLLHKPNHPTHRNEISSSLSLFPLHGIHTGSHRSIKSATSVVYVRAVTERLRRRPNERGALSKVAFVEKAAYDGGVRRILRRI